MCVESMTGIGKAVKLGAADWLTLASTPTFALMALVEVFDGASGMHDAGSHGMALMYVLMSVFHAAPWLKLLATVRRRKQAA